MTRSVCDACGCQLGAGAGFVSNVARRWLKMSETAHVRRFSGLFCHVGRSFPTVRRRLPVQRTRSSADLPQQRPTGHPQIAQCDQRDQLRGVFGQSPIAHLGKPKLALDYPKRMFDIGPDAGLDLPDLLEQLVVASAHVYCPALAWAQGHMPIDSRCLGPLHRPLVARIGEPVGFFSLQQRMA